MSFRVAKVEASTVQSRLPGFVTIGPTTTRSVSARMRERITKGSCQSTGESNTQTWVKPLASARCASSITP